MCIRRARSSRVWKFYILLCLRYNFQMFAAARNPQTSHELTVYATRQHDLQLGQHKLLRRGGRLRLRCCLPFYICGSFTGKKTDNISPDKNHNIRLRNIHMARGHSVSQNHFSLPSGWDFMLLVNIVFSYCAALKEDYMLYLSAYRRSKGNLGPWITINRYNLQYKPFQSSWLTNTSIVQQKTYTHFNNTNFPFHLNQAGR